MPLLEGSDEEYKECSLSNGTSNVKVKSNEIFKVQKILKFL